MQLARFINKQLRISNQQVKQALQSGLVTVNGDVVICSRHQISRYCEVWFKGRCLQQSKQTYLMLHKPVGYLSATVDDKHPTVMSLLPEEMRTELHIAGRLDLNSSGLLLLTNDGRWSRYITEPKQSIGKTYVVDLAYPICPDTEDVFARGIYFQCEDITTQPAQLQLITPTRIRLTIYEGRYHQIKRMFAHVGNRVVAIHRETVGKISLDDQLEIGQWRRLTTEEIALS